MLTRVVGVRKDTGLTGPCGSTSAVYIPCVVAHGQLLATVTAASWAIAVVELTQVDRHSATPSVLTQLRYANISATPPTIFPTHFSSHGSPLASLRWGPGPMNHRPFTLLHPTMAYYYFLPTMCTSLAGPYRLMLRLRIKRIISMGKIRNFNVFYNVNEVYVLQRQHLHSTNELPTDNKCRYINGDIYV